MAESAAPAERGSLVIADRVVERVAAIAAREIETVTERRSGWSHALRRSLPQVTAKVAGGRARVLVQVAAPWPTPLSSMASEVRDHVRERVTTLTGLTVTGVDVRVSDMVAPSTGERRSPVERGSR